MRPANDEISVRAVARSLGLAEPENFRLVRDLFGYATGAPAPLSLLGHVRLLGGGYIHLNLIRVGVEAFTDADEQEIDAAVHFTRGLYGRVGLGVGRVERYAISTAEAGGREHIDSDSEATDLTEEWTVPNDAMDIFLVLTYSCDTVGRSAVDGPCDKDAKIGMNGSVVAIEHVSAITDLVLAHEAGHYLGLEHREDDSSNFMHDTVPNGGQITSDQAATMGSHCFVGSDVALEGDSR